MKLLTYLVALISLTAVFSFHLADPPAYVEQYRNDYDNFKKGQLALLELVERTDPHNEVQRKQLITVLHRLRMQLKAQDFWFRYLEPVAYRKLNGPLPVEWETEVFEKYEPPYRREGAGMTLLELALEEEGVTNATLAEIVRSSLEALPVFASDSIRLQLADPATFYFANRLFLLNLGAIYTTGFECPDTSRIIPELKQMMNDVQQIYREYDHSHKVYPLQASYWKQFQSAIAYLSDQSDLFSQFDHFTWLRDHVNPLFVLNQQMIHMHGLYSKSLVDYSLNESARSIFDKNLYVGQRIKGLYGMVEDERILKEIRETGKQLFYDPILSDNNQRSCASCHQPTQFFTDTMQQSAFQLDGVNRLPRNTLSLVNAVFNHLLMNDGRHIDLQEQAKSVIAHPLEMGKGGEEILAKVMSCPDYKNAFRKWMRFTPGEQAVTMDHIASALSIYYSSFSYFEAPFDNAINKKEALNPEAIRGFNLFMSKAQCGTCHFVPYFNGVKPPYTSSEFEVIGVPQDTTYSKVSEDEGRYAVHPVPEMMNAFRTGTLRNIFHTAPYMHNGVFRHLQEVMDFYNKGGAQGRGLSLPNQTLRPESLELTTDEVNAILAFLQTLNESVKFEAPPSVLPRSADRSLNPRKVGGAY